MTGGTVVVVGPISDDVRELLEPFGFIWIDVPAELDVSGATIVSCPDTAVESRVAVTRLLEARGRGVPWSSMAVAVASPSSQPMLIDALKAAEIPFFCATGRALSQSAVARFVIGCMRAAPSNWNRGSVSSLWSAVPLIDPDSGRLVPVAQWERVSRRWGVVDAHDWPVLAQRCERGGASYDVEVARSLSAFIERLSATVGSGSVDALGVAISTFLLNTDAPLAWGLYGASNLAEGEAIDTVRRVLASMPEAALDGAPLAADDRILWFERALAQRTMIPEGRIGEGVQVATPEALALGTFDELVVVGMSDEASRREGERRMLRSAALAALVNGRAVTLTVPRAGARSQREVAPFPGLLEALTRRHGKPVTAEDVHHWPPKVDGVDCVPSMTSARSSSAWCVPLDATEHDLSNLQAWVANGSDLLADASPVSSSLRRSVVSGRARRSDSWTAFDGRIDELSGWSPTNTVWSVTRMEAFHQCRLRVFLTEVLGARPLDRPEDASDPEARSVGTFVHKVMEYLAGELLAVDASVRPSWSPWVRTLSAAQISAIVDRAVNDLRADGKLGRGPWWDAQVRWLEARIVHYLAGEAVNDDGFEPVSVEGGPTRDDPWLVPTSAGDVRLQGRADRVEAHGSAIRVVDFKTGSLRSLRKLDGAEDPLDAGRKLQLPVYAAMNAERLGLDVSGASGVYVNPLSPNRSSRRVALDVGSLVDPATAVLQTAFDAMANGMFTYETVSEKGNERFCEYCDVKSSCPVDRIQMGRTKAAAAAAVVSDEVGS